MSLQECRLTPDKQLERDAYISEFHRNNDVLTAPDDKLWRIVRGWTAFYGEQFLKDPEQLMKDITDRTEYTTGPGYYLPGVPDDLWESKYKDSAIKVYDHLRVPFELADRLMPVYNRNSDLLKKICRMDLEARLGTYKGVYMHCGFDLYTLSELGGQWLAIEPLHTPPRSRYGSFEPLLSSGRIRLLTSDGQQRSSKDNLNKFSDAVRSYNPDVVLIKSPEPGATYEELLEFYKNNLRKPVVIVSENPIKGGDRISNIAGLDGLDDLGLAVIYREKEPFSLCKPLRGLMMHLYGIDTVQLVREAIISRYRIRAPKYQIRAPKVLSAEEIGLALSRRR